MGPGAPALDQPGHLLRVLPDEGLPQPPTGLGALKGLGFTRVRVLILADSFRADWVERGYPIAR